MMSENVIKHKCDYAKSADENGKFYCEHKRAFCNGCGNLFDIGENGKFCTIEKKDVCKESSLFGNYYLTLTDEDIDNAKNGKVLALTEGEYNIFVMYKGSDDDAKTESKVL